MDSEIKENRGKMKRNIIDVINEMLENAYQRGLNDGYKKAKEEMNAEKENNNG